MLKLSLVSVLSLMLVACATSNNRPEPKNMYAGLGDVYAQANHFAEAENYYEKAHSADPNKTDVMLKLAGVQTQQGKFNQAGQTYQDILVKEPQNRIARYRLARVQMSNGELSLALTSYQQLLEADKKDYQAFNGLGVLLDNLAQSQLARQCYQQGLGFSPNDYALANNLGVSYAISGELSKSKMYFSKASGQSITTRPKDNIILVDHYYEKFKDPLLRQAALKKALLIQTQDVLPKTLIAEAKDAAKKWCG